MCFILVYIDPDCQSPGLLSGAGMEVFAAWLTECGVWVKPLTVGKSL